MKILYLVHQFYPMHYTGTEKFLLNLSSMMQKWGNKVKVVAYSFYDDNFYDRKSGDDILYKEFTYRGIPVLAFKYLKPWDLNYALEHPAFSSFAEKILEQEKPDLVHVAHPMRVGEFIKGILARGIPYIITLTDFFLICPKVILLTSKETLCDGPQGGNECKKMCGELDPQSVKMRLRRGEEILDNAAEVISPSNFLANVVRMEFPSLAVNVIPHGIDYSVIKHNRRTYSRGDAITFCYAGQLSFHKGVHVLLEAFRSIDSSSVRLKLYGSGPEDALRKFREIAGNDARVEFCGVYSPSQVGEIYSGIDALVIPSNWHENNPIVLNEAIACNVPLIVSSAGALIDRVRKNIDGEVFGMNEPRQLAGILQNIVNEPSQLNNWKMKQREIHIPTIEQEAAQYGTEYRGVMSQLETT